MFRLSYLSTIGLILRLSDLNIACLYHLMFLATHFTIIIVQINYKEVACNFDELPSHIAMALQIYFNFLKIKYSRYMQHCSYTWENNVAYLKQVYLPFDTVKEVVFFNLATSSCQCSFYGNRKEEINCIDRIKKASK